MGSGYAFERMLSTEITHEFAQAIAEWKQAEAVFMDIQNVSTRFRIPNCSTNNLYSANWNDPCPNVSISNM